MRSAGASLLGVPSLFVIAKGNCFAPVSYTSTLPHDAGVEEVVYISRLCSNYIVHSSGKCRNGEGTVVAKKLWRNIEGAEV